MYSFFPWWSSAVCGAGHHTLPLLSVLIMGTVRWSCLGRRHEGRHIFIFWLPSPATACPTCMSLQHSPIQLCVTPVSALLCQKCLGYFLVSHKRKTGSLWLDPAFCRQRHENEGRGKRSLQPASCLLCNISLLNRNK